MALISKEDREYIENKYHRQDEYFDPFNRLNYHGYEYDASTGLDDAEMRAALESLYEETKTEPHALAKAKGFAFVLDNARIDVPANDYFFGFYNWARPLPKRLLTSGTMRCLIPCPILSSLCAIITLRARRSFGWTPSMLCPTGLTFCHSVFRAFYKRDMENGTFTKDQIKSFLAYFMLQYSAVGNYFG